MVRITTVLLLVMFWSGTAFAVVYQCRDKDGNLFLTNNRSKFPPGCVQVGGAIGEERAPSPPAATPPAVQGSRPEMNNGGRAPTPSRVQASPAPGAEATPAAPAAETAEQPEEE